ncbi:Putative metal chaperone, involved in Zn homeostasis, GTPase of COG0523 family [[Actinomadura] parvosata subsp. kistnae]|nr:Putative metal chaperone, involved in Zn homeostasis, GTPase of COG0523 family [Actinomadura parvosata subsp. kistnae]
MTLSGFLGAGKTTTLVEVARRLRTNGERVAVITNDQGSDLVDTRLARSASSEAGEVTGGCFCCRFDDLLDVARELIDNHRVETLLAEAVGSCADLQATVLRPLRRYYGDTFTAGSLMTVVDPERLAALRETAAHNGDADLSYLFGKQLEEADVIALNKIDLLDPDTIRDTLDDLHVRYPAATVVGYSARSGRGLDQLMNAWLGEPPAPRNVEIDYNRYARAEAALAWLNQTLVVRADEGLDGDLWARTLLEHLSRTALRMGWTVGHAKVSLHAPGVLTRLSLTRAGGAPVADGPAPGPLPEAEARINARVACKPGELDEAVDAAVREATEAAAAQVERRAGERAFQPAYPLPVHRLAAPDPSAPSCGCGGDC